MTYSAGDRVYWRGGHWVNYRLLSGVVLKVDQKRQDGRHYLVQWDEAEVPMWFTPRGLFRLPVLNIDKDALTG